MPSDYEVHTYSIDALCRALSEKASADIHVIEEKRHRVYFEEYFAAIGARTIVVECAYTDRDYLEDFAGYYVRCFQDYRKTCSRFHFFSNDFTLPDWEAFLEGDDTAIGRETLQENYLGFVVVKPLPQTILGRTCLKTYPHEHRRYFPITRRYEVNLFGLPLHVDSLAFQEQDSVAAACATSALWSAFQATGLLFHHTIPSPVEITKSATLHAPARSRTLPNNNGLDAIQMAEAIRNVGLEPYTIDAQNGFVLKSTVYAYLRGQIPPVLGIALFDPPTNTYLDFHAIAVTGYSLGLPQSMPYGPSGFLLTASRMDKLYAHDDQIGPFARMPFLANGRLDTSWLDTTGMGTQQATPDILLIPLYHKIRIPLDTILDIIFHFDESVERLRQRGGILLAERLEWDIYLTTINTMKTEYFENTTLDKSVRRVLLSKPMPRFLWRATATCGDDTVVDLFFDATDIETGGPNFVCAVEYDAAFALVLRNIAPIILNQPQNHTRPDLRIFKWFAIPP